MLYLSHYTFSCSRRYTEFYFIEVILLPLLRDERIEDRRSVAARLLRLRLPRGVGQFCALCGVQGEEGGIGTRRNELE